MNPEWRTMVLHTLPTFYDGFLMELSMEIDVEGNVDVKMDEGDANDNTGPTRGAREED
eukprot:TRINITY_DN13339_c0_g1_i1.p2 TRINITY_DN13339_c0_g1~~TRINITY_DN13339_c0_g1_i1.p2  ORF type:complete len:58 (+),score=16.36 TRINITY_DN13339_c0_g1_i1:482-655(+)